MTRLRILIRAGGLIATDRRVPRWLRWGIVASVAVPLPGPVDELVAVVLLAVVWIGWRPVIRENYVKASLASPATPPRQDGAKNVPSAVSAAAATSKRCEVVE